MNGDAKTFSLEDVYGETDPEGASDAVDRSRNPRGPMILYDKAGELGLSPQHRLLDAGSGAARHAVGLVERFGCHAVALEAVPFKVRRAKDTVSGGGFGGRIEVLEGRIEAVPAGDGTFDIVWCRDVLNHLPDLRAGLTELARVMKAEGSMLVFHTFATELLEPAEASRLYPPLAVVPRNMSPDHFEDAAGQAGLRVVEREEIGSEWREWDEEHGTGRTSRQLLRISHLRRDAERLTAELGPKSYATELADCTWGVYQMLGKLSPRVYVLRKNRLS